MDVDTSENSEKSENDELLINIKTWNKLYNTASTSGYRDGITVGKESNFQDSFDKGYYQGFKNGFELGLRKGMFSANNNDEKAILLKKISRGNCVICKDRLEKKSIEELIALQTVGMTDILSKLNINK